MSTTIGSKPGRDKPKCEAKRRGGDGLCQRPAGWGTDHPGIGRSRNRDKPKRLMEADIAALTAWNRTHKRGLEGSK